MARCLNCMKEFEEQYGICPHCGYLPGNQPKEAYQLTPGIRLAGRYIVGTALGVGGFGITYRAWDETLQKMTAVKEYYPSANGIVNRVPGEAKVIVYSGERAVEFHRGKERFLAEARSMAKFNTHPNIVHVFDFFEEHGTAYIVMEFLDGVSYKQFIASNGGRIGESIALEVTVSVLDALKEIHQAGIIHRDISPDNVFICQGGVIKLIDFGAARFSTGEEEKTLSIILKPGYAPPEQYRSRSRQGPWTDIYAVGAMLYRAITGKMPEESVNRMVQDNLIPPNEIVPEISENLSNSIMRAMALNQELRFQNAGQFRDAIQNKAKVLDVGTELKRRKIFRMGIIGGVFGVLLTAGITCFSVIHNKRAEAVLQDAVITVWYPGNQGELEADEWEELGRADAAEDSGFPDMVQAYRKLYPNIELDIKEIPADEYEERLEEAIRTGRDMPVVFDSSCLSEDFYGQMASLDQVYEWMEEGEELDRYYFMDEYRRYFPEEKQIPLSFQIPVIYYNSLMAEKDPAEISSMPGLKEIVNQEGSYGVNEAVLPAYEVLAPDIRPEYGREDFLLDLTREGQSGGDGSAFDAEREKEAMLEGKVVYYLSDTSEYEQIQNRMAGAYGVALLKDMPVQGRFSNLWSVSEKADTAQKKAGTRLIYFLLSKENQETLNLMNSNGLPLHKEVMEEYEKTNREFEGLIKSLPEVVFTADSPSTARRK